MFATAGKSLNIYNFNGGTLECASPYFPNSGESIEKFQWCHDNTYIALLGDGGTVEIVSTKDTNDIKLVHIITAFQNVSALSFKWKTKRILALGNNVGEVVFYDTKNRNLSKFLSKFPSGITALGFTCDDCCLAVLYGKNMAVFDLLQDLDVVPPMELQHVDICTALSFYKQFPNKIAVGCRNGTIQVWDLKLKLELGRYERHKKEVTGIKTCGSDKILMTTGMDNKLCFLDAVDEAVIFHTKSLYQPITSMDVSPNNEYVIVGLEDGTLFVYDLRDHLKPLATPRVYTQGAVKDISFSNSEDFEVMTDHYNAPISPQISPRSYRNQKFQATSTETGSVNSSHENENADMNKNENKTFQKESAAANQAKYVITKLIKNNFEKLQEHLNEQVAEYEMFITSEFEAIQEKISRWEVFKVGDYEEFFRAMLDIANKNAVASLSKKNSQKYYD